MGIEDGYSIKYRYPGTKFFEADQKEIFFGRNQECRDLIHAIKAHDVFVIFADSGIGKTSLLNAGLIPELINENIEPIRFRFQDTTTSPIQEISNKLGSYKKTDTFSPAEKEQRLWHLFKSCDFKNKKPLFVFDQFEEFFNHSKQLRDDCINELADLVNEYLPDDVRSEMREKFRDQDPTKEELLYYAPIRIKMLFLIRADKLKLLDDLSKKIPLILRNRFQLRPLNVEQAEQAIRIPASLRRNGFASPPFGFEQKTIEGICTYLKNQEGEVESFQLQILCQELEKRIMNRQTEKPGESLLITEEELGGEQGMDDITKNYYGNQISSIPDEKMKKKALELIEDKLIVEDRRISLPEVLLTNQGFTKDLLDYLLNTTRLIRVDNDRYYEISHDRLLPSILKSKRQRHEEDEKLNKIAELQRLKAQEEEKNRQLWKEREEQLRFLQLEKRTKKRLRIFSVILAILLIGLLVALYYANESRIEAKLATVNTLLLQKEYEVADTVMNYGGFLNSLSFSFGDSLKNLKDTIQVRKEQKEQFYTLSRNADTLQMLAASLEDRGLSLLDVGDSVIVKEKNKEAEKLFSDAIKLFKQAEEKYRQAQKTGFIPHKDEDKVEEKLDDIARKISEGP